MLSLRWRSWDAVAKNGFVSSVCLIPANFMKLLLPCYFYWWIWNVDAYDACFVCFKQVLCCFVSRITGLTGLKPHLVRTFSIFQLAKSTVHGFLPRNSSCHSWNAIDKTWNAHEMIWNVVLAYVISLGEPAHNKQFNVRLGAGWYRLNDQTQVSCIIVLCFGTRIWQTLDFMAYIYTILQTH